MIFLLFVVSALCARAADTVAFTDGSGRVLQVPREVRRIYATSPVANVLLYTLAPEKMVGWNYKLNPNEARFILPSVRNLPALGGWFGPSGTGNRETLLAAKPDVILSIGYNDATAIDFAERLQAQIGIPVLVASGRLQDFADTYEMLGTLCGAAARAKELAAYCRRTLDEAKALAETIPPEKRLRVYYAEGPRGLQTDTKGSLHAETLDLVGGENVAQGEHTENFGRAGVSLEQVIAWKPEVMLICPEKSDSASRGCPNGLPRRPGAACQPWQMTAFLLSPANRSTGSTARLQSIACLASNGSPGFFIPIGSTSTWLQRPESSTGCSTITR